MKYVLALDQGTTSSRAILFDHGGKICGVAQQEFPQYFPQPGWVEHDPEEIWTSQLAVARDVLAQVGAKATDVAALGIANQRETTILWDRATGTPIGRAIVWQDRRTSSLCDQLIAQGHAAIVRKRTGLEIDAYFSGSKIAWLLDNVPGARQRAQRGELAFGTVDTWLIWNLTGGTCHGTDISNASRTMLYDLRNHRWDDELLRILRVPASLLPSVFPSSGVLAKSQPQWLGAAVSIAGLAGDQQAALFGQMCVQPGMAKNTYGTGCFLLLNTGSQPVDSRHRLLTTAAWELDGQTSFALEGAVFVAGAAVQWLRDGLGLIASARDIEALAASVPDSGGVVFVPALTGLGAPHWDPDARGSIRGLTRGTTRAHLARATLEGVAQQVADVLDAMQQDAGILLQELRVDGGAASNNLLLQIQADLLGVPVVRPTITETTALGAAYLAGLAVGFWRNRDELASRWREDRRFVPSLPRERAQLQRAQWRTALDRTRTR